MIPDPGIADETVELAERGNCFRNNGVIVRDRPYIAGQRHQPARKIGRELRDLLGRALQYAKTCALRDETLDDRAPQPRAAAGDQHNLIGEPDHDGAIT